MRIEHDCLNELVLYSNSKQTNKQTMEINSDVRLMSVDDNGGC